ncbi:hypothetical protein DJ031_04550 [bacterium endosymbiont of Escarpia laminata]|nr:MAG: hypothetical protein DJ031_04550 [bacterium endosymbiont of Escarpia laminata]
MQFMPTNDVFFHLLNILQLHKDKDLIIELFESQNIEISRSKIKAWDTKTGRPTSGYREMPREALDAFIKALYERRLVEVDK